MVDRLLTALKAPQKGTTAQWYSNETSLNFRGVHSVSCLFYHDGFPHIIS